MFLALVTILVAVASVSLGAIVLTRNYHSLYNVTFALFAITLGLWIPANFFGSFYNPNPSKSFLFYADFTLAPFLALFFMHFGSQTLRFYKPKVPRIENPLVLVMTIILTAILSLAAIIKLVATPIYSAGGVDAQKQILYYPYTFVEVIFAVVGLGSIIFATTRASRQYRQQTRTVLIGVFIGAVTIILSNVVLPNLVQGVNQGAHIVQDSSYFGALIMLFLFSYSIIRHRLFDIRLIVARSLAYLLLLASLAGLFVVTIFAATSIFFQNKNLDDTSVRLTFAIIAIILAFALQPLKGFFDRITNKIFYRDAYDSQELLNELNKSLIATIDLKVLLEKSAKIISDTLKVEHISFAVHGAQTVDSLQQAGLRFVGGSETYFDKELLKSVVASAAHNRQKVLVADELEQDNHHLRELLQKANTAVFVKLEGKTVGRNQRPGYILLGSKRSGGLYSPQDVRVLEIIADELVIATQNALRFEEISQFNITLRQKVEEATKELRHVNSRLRELDKTKDEFISMASHQLRTPLTTVKGYLSMLLEGDIGSVKKEQKEILQNAFDGSNRMVYLIADLLNVSRLQSGKFVIDNKPTDLAEVVQGEVEQLRAQALTRQVELNYKRPEHFPALALDETKIRQVIMNFLDNALYYTPKGGKVDVVLTATDSTVSYTVTDTGLGVPKEVQHHLFTKFYRADNAKKMRPDGTGLGLFMAKKVVVAQGGAIIFKSTEGKGSTFGFSFPRRSMEIKGVKAAQATSAGEKTSDKPTP